MSRFHKAPYAACQTCDLCPQGKCISDIPCTNKLGTPSEYVPREYEVVVETNNERS